MKRVLMVSPHFPPDTSAGTHRVRLLAPHLSSFGWEPTVVTVDPRDYEGRLDEELQAMVPDSLRVVRVRAWSPRCTRKVGFGDLGLRSLHNLYVACRELLRRERFDCLFVTIFPAYPSLLGPLLKRRVSIPFVLDYQDPWVSAWGLTTGGGAGGRPDARSRLSRALATRLEPLAVRAANGLTAVSDGTLDGVRERIPEARGLPSETLPIGGDPADFDHLRAHPRSSSSVERRSGKFELRYVGTLLPLGMETLRAFLGALARLKDRHPDAYARLHVSFVGTSNQTSAGEARVLPEAERLGVSEVVSEHPDRVDYLDALELLATADAILLMGSTEHHYTASKLYPALLAKRPLLALYHEKSSVVPILEGAVEVSVGRVVTYGDVDRAESRVDDIVSNVLGLLERGPADPSAWDLDAVACFSARRLAERLAGFFSRLERS